MVQGAIIIEGHVQGLSNVRSLGELGIPIYVIDKDIPLAKFSRYCQKYFRCHNYSDDELIKLLISIAQKEHLKNWLLLPSNDHIVENLVHHKSELQPYYKYIGTDTSILDIITNKLNLVEFADAHNVPTPHSCNAASIDIAKTFSYPLLVKGAKGLSFYKATHQKAIQANTLEELLQITQSLKGIVAPHEIMIQELIPSCKKDKVVSFTCFAIDGEIKAHWSGVKIREHPIKYGTATCAMSVNIPEVLDHAKALINSLGYTGICEIEFLKDNRDSQYKLIEINPRTWLWVGLAKACGVDYAKMLYYYASDISHKYINDYENGRLWVNSLTDFVFSIQAILKKQITFSEYLSTLKRNKVHAIWSWSDIIPGIIFPFMSFYIAIKRK